MNLKRWLCGGTLIGVWFAGPVQALNVCTNHGHWTDAAIWEGGVPAAGQDVLIPAGKTVTVSSATAVLNSLTNSGTLIFTNWTTLLSAGNITIDGLVTLPAAYTNNQMSNRVWMACTNLTLTPTGQIDVRGRGYQGGAGTSGWGNGPGAGTCSSYYGGGGLISVAVGFAPDKIARLIAGLPVIDVTEQTVYRFYEGILSATNGVGGQNPGQPGNFVFLIAPLAQGTIFILF